MKKFLRKAKRALIKTFGSVIDEYYWKFRHIFSDNRWAESYISQFSLDHPHRKLLIDKISGHSPFSSLLEIGCASGPNLYLLSKKFPKTEFYGTDINSQALEIGRKWFKKRNIGNIKFLYSKAGDLGRFPDKSTDIVLTDAVLIYIGPEKIKHVIREMIRIAKKSIILNEWHSSDFLHPSYEDNWVYNYAQILGEFLPVERIKFTKIPEEIWPQEGWKKFGYVIEIDLGQG